VKGTKTNIFGLYFVMGPPSIPLKYKRKWSICVITIHWGIKNTRKMSVLLQSVDKKSPLPPWIGLQSAYGPLTVRSRSTQSLIIVSKQSDHGPLTVRLRSAHSPITVHSQSDDGQLTVRSRSTQSPTTISSQPDHHGQLTVRSRSAHNEHKSTSVRNSTVP